MSFFMIGSAHSSFLSQLEVSKPAKSRYSAFSSIGKFMWSLRVEPCLVHERFEQLKRTKRFSPKLLWLSSKKRERGRRRLCKHHCRGERISLYVVKITCSPPLLLGARKWKSLLRFFRAMRTEEGKRSLSLQSSQHRLCWCLQHVASKSNVNKLFLHIFCHLLTIIYSKFCNSFLLLFSI